MRKALVLTVLIAGIGAAASSSPISGSAEVCATFDDSGVLSFDTVIDVDYTISGIVLGAKAIFNLDQCDNLFFTAQGALEPIDFRTMIDFEPQTPTFMAWTSAAKIDLGGATLFGVFAMQIHILSWLLEPSYGVGATLGIFATVGDLKVTAASCFNMPDWTSFYHYDFDATVALDVVQDCDLDWLTPFWIPYTVLNDDCCLCWSGASIYADFPLFCLDVTAHASFACVDPTYPTASAYATDFGFDIYEIELGIPWLSIYDL
jgi:hypothetical protein